MGCHWDRLNRREFVLGAAGLGLVAGCGRLPWQAQPPPKVPQVGLLWASEVSNPHYEAFLAGLRELGYVEERNVFTRIGEPGCYWHPLS
jgi:hypothetical protein